VVEHYLPAAQQQAGTQGGSASSGSASGDQPAQKKGIMDDVDAFFGVPKASLPVPPLSSRFSFRRLRM